MVMLWARRLYAALHKCRLCGRRLKLGSSYWILNDAMCDGHKGGYFHYHCGLNWDQKTRTAILKKFEADTK